MEESNQNIRKTINIALQEIRRMGLSEEVARLVTDDIEYGIPIGDIYLYAKSGKNIKYMEVYSRCLRAKCSKEAIEIITSDALNHNQMMVALNFYEKGIKLDTIKEVIENDNNAFKMSQIFKNILIQMEESKEEIKAAPEYVKELFEDIKEVVANIKFDDSRLIDLNEKLNKLESFNEDIGVRDDLIKNISEKDILLANQKDKVNQANQAVSRLREEREIARKEIKSLKEEIKSLKENTNTGNNYIESNNSYNKSPNYGSRDNHIDTNPYGENQVTKNQTIRNEDRNLYNYRIPSSAIDTSNKKSKKSLVDLIYKIIFRKSSKLDIVKMVVAGELSPEQLSLVKIAIEKGLKEKQLAELINNKISAEQMREIIEIAVLENALEEVM